VPSLAPTRTRRADSSPVSPQRGKRRPPAHPGGLVLYYDDDGMVVPESSLNALRKSLLALCAVGVLVAIGGCRRAVGPTAEQAHRPPAVATGWADLRNEVAEVVAAHRQTILLMADEATLPGKDRALAPVVGKLLFEGTIPRLRSIQDRLEAESHATVHRASPGTSLLDAFLGWLEANPDLHDADKLAFLEVVIHLAEDLEATPPLDPAGRARLARLVEDRTALEAIRRLYDRELDVIFARLQTRGMPVRREAWESYLASLRARHTALEVLESHRAQVAPVEAAPLSSRESGVGLPDKTLVLSFDDGPSARYTPKILEILQRFGARAVFFEVGENLGAVDTAGNLTEGRAAKASRAALAAGNLLGNHTNTHPFLPKLPPELVDEELDVTSRLLRAVDQSGPVLFRPPYGALSDSVRGQVAHRELAVMMWNIDSRDWADPVPKSIANRVIAEARAAGRGIVLFHDIHARTVEALPLVLETLQAEGFTFALWNGAEILHRSPAATPPPAPQALAAEPLYRESFAVIVGIDEYQHWPRLSYATRDALAVRDLLVGTYGFKPENLTVLLNGEATRERILAVLGDSLGNDTRVLRDDRVLVFFAGHGATRRLASGRSLGYIVPVDADLDNLQSQCISMTNFQDIDEAIPAKHVLYIMDACYGGLALLRGGTGAVDPRNYLAEVTRRRTRQMLTAGGPEEQVADGGPEGHSIFTWTVLQGLAGKADLNGDAAITAGELFAYVGPVVSSLSRQTPAFGSLVGSEGGEFVFELRHEDEYLSALSAQLDDEAITLNARLESARAEIMAKRARNEALQRELAAAQTELVTMGAAPQEPSPAEAARQKTDEGLAFYRERKYTEALGCFRDAFRLQPSNPQVANNIGFVYFRLGDFEKALEWYHTALALDGKRAIAWANSGEALEKLGQTGQAVEAYERFLALAPRHGSATYVRERLRVLGADPPRTPDR
jgi:peptidoglycan/xylan/chitin deacetylase (PgdA/CDA1 family)/uncharacterized caspase-like protein